jgi:hypothetical protein
MTLRISTSIRNAMVDAVKTLIDAGSGAGKIRIYTGSQPASVATAASGTLLADIPLADPSFGATATGSAAADVSPVLTATAGNSGTAGWFRVLDSDNNALIDGSVTATGGGGDLTLATTAVTSGLDVSITALTLTQPIS